MRDNETTIVSHEIAATEIKKANQELDFIFFTKNLGGKLVNLYQLEAYCVKTAYNTPNHNYLQWIVALLKRATDEFQSKVSEEDRRACLFIEHYFIKTARERFYDYNCSVIEAVCKCKRLDQFHKLGERVYKSSTLYSKAVSDYNDLLQKSPVHIAIAKKLNFSEERNRGDYGLISNWFLEEFTKTGKIHSVEEIEKNWEIWVKVINKRP